MSWMIAELRDNVSWSYYGKELSDDKPKNALP